MKMRANNMFCPTDEIASYIDGELDAAREREVDAHFAECAACSDELNLQKQFLRNLESSLKQEGDVVLPADFTRKVVANAESTVSGLRRPRERFNAIFICAGLMFFILFALGTDAGRVLGGAGAVVDQIATVGSFFGHFIYSFFLGVMIVVRTCATQIRPDALAAVVIAVLMVISIGFVSQRLLRMRRA